jgi:hypothetical protein
MRQLLKILLLSILIFPFISCSSTSQSVKDEGYRIDYYTGGGVTGIESGLTIFNGGQVIFWDKLLNKSRHTTDSLMLSDEQIVKIDSIIKSPELFTYSHKYTGNYTAHLVIIKDIQLNQISYNGAEIPAEMPDSIKDLISEIQSLFKIKAHR